MQLKNWAETYQQKLLEAGYLNVVAEVFGEEIVITYDAADQETVNSVEKLLMLKRNFNSKMLYYISSIGARYETRVTVDAGFERPITDMDRLNNKLFKQHKNSPYEHHAKKFVDSLKQFYNISISSSEYDELCMNAAQSAKLKLRKIYAINGAVMVASMVLQNKTIYIIHGKSGQRHLPQFKTCLPDIESEKTMLPVPDSLLLQGIDRVAFSKLVRETVIEKRQYFQKLFKELENKSDKELFLSSDITKEEKVFIKKLRRPKPITYQIHDAVEELVEKYRRSRIFQGSTSQENLPDSKE